MSFDDPVPLFRTILENVDRLARFTEGLDYGGFVANEEKVFAVRAAMIELSEAAIRLGPDAEALCPGMPWKEIRGIGNHLRHGYDRIDLERLWNTVKEDLPALRQAVAGTLQRLAPPSSL